MNVFTIMTKKALILSLATSLSLNAVGSEIVESAKILGGSIAAACLYGLVNDQVTVRVCPEYFTEGFHKTMVQGNILRGNLSNEFGKKLLDSNNKTLIGLYWGVAATWWFGALLGVPTTIAARAGSYPKVGMNELIRPLAAGMTGLLGMSLCAGILGYLKAKNNPQFRKHIQAVAAGRTPDSAMNRYTADVAAHQVGYAGGAVVGLGLIGYTLLKRLQQAKAAKLIP